MKMVTMERKMITFFLIEWIILNYKSVFILNQCSRSLYNNKLLTNSKLHVNKLTACWLCLQPIFILPARLYFDDSLLTWLPACSSLFQLSQLCSVHHLQVSIGYWQHSNITRRAAVQHCTLSVLCFKLMNKAICSLC